MPIFIFIVFFYNCYFSSLTVFIVVTLFQFYSSVNYTLCDSCYWDRPSTPLDSFIVISIVFPPAILIKIIDRLFGIKSLIILIILL